MAPIGTLYGPPGHALVQRPLAVAAYGGVEVTTTPNFEHFKDNKAPEYVAKFAGGKVPGFQGTDDFLLTETIAITKYVAKHSSKSAQLLGANDHEQALVDQWLSFAQTELHPTAGTVLRILRGMIPYTKPAYTTAIDNNHAALTVLEKHLASRTFLISERITVADIYTVQTLKMALTYTMGKAERERFPNVMRFFETVYNVPEIKSIFGDVEYLDKPPTFTPPKKEKPAAEAKPKEPKAEKPKAEPKPKAEKKPKDEDEDDGDIDLVPAEEPKAKNPLDSLPKSTFNLEDWKRAYSNMETRGAGGSLEWFYKNFDAEGFSIWRVDFKYNEELTQTFMSSNQIGGFFNRLEASRKYLFGSVGVCGKPNDSVISGVFVCRGPDVKPVVEVAPDWESYEYKAIDLKDDAQKAFFESAMAWDLELDGKAWADGKNFK